MILSTSAEQSFYYDRMTLRYLAMTIFFALLGAIYEWFSFGVYSYFMIYAFAFSLLGGVLPYAWLGYQKRRRFEEKCNTDQDRMKDDFPHNRHNPMRDEHFPAHTLWGAGIATFSVGSAFCGALEIYGTSSPFSKIYWITGCGLCAAAICCHFVIANRI